MEALNTGFTGDPVSEDRIYSDSGIETTSSDPSGQLWNMSSRTSYAQTWATPNLATGSLLPTSLGGYQTAHQTTTFRRGLYNPQRQANPS